METWQTQWPCSSGDVHPPNQIRTPVNGCDRDQENILPGPWVDLHRSRHFYLHTQNASGTLGNNPFDCIRGIWFVADVQGIQSETIENNIIDKKV